MHISKLWEHRNYKNLLFIFLILLLIGLAFIPRGTEVLNKNYVFGYDQGRDYLDVKEMVENRKLRLIGPEIGAGGAGFKYIFHGPGFYYLLTIPYILFQGDPYGGVVLMFLLGLLSIGVAFYVGWKIFGLWGGYIFSLLIAISPPLIEQSRFIWNPYPSTPLIILYIYFVYLSIKKRIRFIFLAAFIAAFIYNFELAIAVPLSIGLFFFNIVIQRERRIRSYLVLLAGLLIGYFPMLLFEARHGFPAMQNIVSYFTSPSPASSKKTSVNIFSDHIMSFTYNFINAFSKVEYPVMYLVLFIIVLFGIYLVWREKNGQLQKTIMYLYCLPLITFIAFSFLKTTIWQHYLYHLLIGYLFLFTYVIVSAQRRKMHRLFVLLVVIIGFLTIHGIGYGNKIFNQGFSDYYGGTAKIKGKLDAIDYIYKDAKGEKFGLFVFSPPIYTYPYDYILQWYAAKKYKYLPTQNKNGVFYLLIETDSSQPWTYEGWLKTVIKTGEVQYTKDHSPSTFKIQKRIGTEYSN
jgi:hypothetical protein